MFLTRVYQMSNPVIETDIADILKEIKSDQKKILEEVNALKLGQSEIKGDVKALDTKVEQLDKRISNSELTNRGILIGLVVVILGGVAKLFGFMDNS
jgi:peptidoglycan hydrolase CwlO-like protein